MSASLANLGRNRASSFRSPYERPSACTLRVELIAGDFFAADRIRNRPSGDIVAGHSGHHDLALDRDLAA